MEQDYNNGQRERIGCFFAMIIAIFGTVFGIENWSKQGNDNVDANSASIISFLDPENPYNQGRFDYIPGENKVIYREERTALIKVFEEYSDIEAEIIEYKKTNKFPKDTPLVEQENISRIKEFTYKLLCASFAEGAGLDDANKVSIKGDFNTEKDNGIMCPDIIDIIIDGKTNSYEGYYSYPTSEKKIQPLDVWLGNLICRILYSSNFYDVMESYDDLQNFIKMYAPEILFDGNVINYIGVKDGKTYWYNPETKEKEPYTYVEGEPSKYNIDPVNYFRESLYIPPYLRNSGNSQSVCANNDKTNVERV